MGYKKDSFMSLVGWILLGLVAGFIVWKVMGCLTNLVLGTVLVIVCGVLVGVFGHYVWFHYSHALLIGAVVVAIAALWFIRRRH